MQGRRVHGNRLRNLRERAGLRTVKLAADAGCSHGHLRNIEGGSDQPGGVLAYTLARILAQHLGQEITIDDFSETDDEQRRAA